MVYKYEKTYSAHKYDHSIQRYASPNIHIQQHFRVMFFLAFDFRMGVIVLFPNVSYKTSEIQHKESKRT